MRRLASIVAIVLLPLIVIGALTDHHSKADGDHTSSLAAEGAALSESIGREAREAAAHPATVCGHLPSLQAKLNRVSAISVALASNGEDTTEIDGRIDVIQDILVEEEMKCEGSL